MNPELLNLILSLSVAAAAGAAVGWWLCRSSHGPITKQDLLEMETRMANTFKSWAAENGPKLQRIQDGIDRAEALIEKLQNSPGVFSAEDQATADALQATLDSIGADADSVPAPPTTEPPAE